MSHAGCGLSSFGSNECRAETTFGHGAIQCITTENTLEKIKFCGYAWYNKGIMASYQLMTPEEAERVAREATEEETDGWTYKAVHAPNGRGLSFVACFDELGEEVGRL